MAAPEIRIRAMTPDDLPAIPPLLDQLGYIIVPEVVTRRFSAVAGSDMHALLVAELGQRVIGFLHVFARPALEKPPEAIVQSLVVDAPNRKRGVGKRLMDAAECWAVERGFGSVALASQIDRDDAHAFYVRLGYRTAATSHLLRKEIAG